MARSEPVGSATARLHERLQSLQSPAFGPVEASDGASASTVSKRYHGIESPRPTPAALAQPRFTDTSLGAAAAERPGARPVAKVASRNEPTPTLAPRKPRSPTVADQPRPTRTSMAAPSGRKASQTAAQPGQSKAAKSLSPSAVEDASVLISRNGPALSVQTLGPPRIVVARESTYRIVVQNSGRTAAEQVTLSVKLPPWARVTGSDASRGHVGEVEAGPDEQLLTWEVGKLDAASQEHLILGIVPRESRPIDLEVTWRCNPAASQAKIEVQEPRIKMRLDGPREVLFGKPERYRLTITNTGTAAAEDLELTIVPLGHGDGVPVTQKLGTLDAGAERVIEMEMTGHQTGALRVRVELRGEPTVEARLDQEVVVVRPQLELDVVGPGLRYIGTEASWRIRVANTGTAPAQKLRLAAQLPRGAELLSSTEPAEVDREGHRVVWTIPSLAIGAEAQFQVACRLQQPGANRLTVTSVAASEVTARAEALTQVEALADLAIEVRDPSGPVPVGQEVAYEIELENRGSKEASDVKVFAYFSYGIEPTAAHGAAHRISPGQVVFDTIPAVGAGEKIVLTIRARADEPGTHVFRAEVQSATLGAPLVEQETTHFYGEASASASKPENESEPTPASPGSGPLRTAGRNNHPTRASAPSTKGRIEAP